MDLERGRGARLSPLGESLLRAEQQARARVGPALRTLEQALATELELSIPATDIGGTRPRIFASHSLVLEVLRKLLVTEGIQLELHFRGSIDSLRLLNQGRCDLAGFHIADPPLAEALCEHYRPWLDRKLHRLIRVVARNQGLIVARGNPHNIRALQDLTGNKIRFINRQPDSGTRLLLDLLMDQAGLSPASIAGYDSEEFTHIAVAALVAGGAADAGPGIQAAAERFGLDFVPLAQETYYLAVRTKALNATAIRTLRRVLQSDSFRQEVASLGGYDTSDAGDELNVDAVIPSGRTS